MKTTLDLPDALVDEVKRRAHDQGRKLNDAVADLLRKGLAATDCAPVPSTRMNVKTSQSTGLPYIQCPLDAPARKMAITDLIALERKVLDWDEIDQISLRLA